MPLIQWIMQNLGMGKPVHNVQGSSGLKLNSNYSVKLGYNYISSGSISFSGQAKIKFFAVGGIGGLKVAGQALYLLTKSNANNIVVVIYDVNPAVIDPFYQNILDNVDVVNDLPIHPDPNSGISSLKEFIVCCDGQTYDLEDQLDIVENIPVLPDYPSEIIKTKVSFVYNNNSDLEDRLNNIKSIDILPDGDIGIIKTVVKEKYRKEASYNLEDKLLLVKNIVPLPDSPQGGIRKQIITSKPIDIKRKALEDKLAILKEINVT